MRYKNSLGSAFLDSLNHALYVLLRQRTTVLHADLGELHGVILARTPFFRHCSHGEGFVKVSG